MRLFYAQVEDVCHVEGRTVPDDVDYHCCDAVGWNLAGVFVPSCQSNKLLESHFRNDPHLLSSRSQVSLLYLFTCV